MVKKLLISGGSGFIGSKVISSFKKIGYDPCKLSRKPVDSPPSPGEIHWEPTAGKIQSDQLEDFDVVIHLAGEPVANARWTTAKKKRMRESRVLGTRLLSQTLASLNQKPHVLLSASAVGFYGDQGDKILTEQSPPGQGFLVDVAKEWEAETQPATDAGIRVVNLRISVILGQDGGALQRMLTPFKLGLGGRLGSGQQYMSWMTDLDLINTMHHCVDNHQITGPVNCSSPNPVTNLEFTKTLGQLINRPTILPVPAFLLKLLLGEMAEGIFLASARMQPEKLIQSGFNFQHELLSDAMKYALNKQT